MNALNNEIISGINKAFHQIEARFNDKVVITNRKSHNFIAGQILK